MASNGRVNRDTKARVNGGDTHICVDPLTQKAVTNEQAPYLPFRRRVRAYGVCANLDSASAGDTGTGCARGSDPRPVRRRRQASDVQENKEQEDEKEVEHRIRNTRTCTDEVSREKHRAELRFEAEVPIIPRLYRLSSQRPRFASPQ